MDERLLLQTPLLPSMRPIKGKRLWHKLSLLVVCQAARVRIAYLHLYILHLPLYQILASRRHTRPMRQYRREHPLRMQQYTALGPPAMQPMLYFWLHPTL